MSLTIYIYTCLPVTTIFIVAVTLITATATVTVVIGYAILDPLEHVVSLVLPPISSLAFRSVGGASSKGCASNGVIVACLVAIVSLMFGNMAWLINHLCLAITLGVVLCSIIGVAIVVPFEQVSNLVSNWAMLLLVLVFLLAALFTGFVALSRGHCNKGCVCCLVLFVCWFACMLWSFERVHIYIGTSKVLID